MGPAVCLVLSACVTCVCVCVGDEKKFSSTMQTQSGLEDHCFKIHASECKALGCRILPLKSLAVADKNHRLCFE